jgi:uncharacterized protein
MISQEQISDIVRRIAEHYQPERIILFGSYANGTPDEDSDLDLLIVKNVEGPRIGRSVDVRRLLLGWQVAMDILVYTPAELEYAASLPITFESEVLRTGKLMYAA